MKNWYLNFYDRYGEKLFPILIVFFLILESTQQHNNNHHILPLIVVLIDLPASIIYRSTPKIISNICLLILNIIIFFL